MKSHSIRCGNTEVKTIICDICQTKFVEHKSLKVHKRLHGVRLSFSCDLCPKKYTEKINLDKHALVHKRPTVIVSAVVKTSIRCDECGKHIGSKSSLNRHKLVHGVINQHDCLMCEKSFNRADL